MRARINEDDTDRSYGGTRLGLFLVGVLLAAGGCWGALPTTGNGGTLGLRAGAPPSESFLNRASLHLRHLYDRERERNPAARRRVSGGADRPFTVAVVSDLNGSYGSKEYSKHVHRTVDWITERLRPDLVVSTGDHVAGQKSGLDYTGMWDAFHRAVTRKFERAGIPFAPTPGNHDASAAEPFSRERRQYVREWNNHRPELDFVDDAHYPLHYAFEAGPALFISIDATLPGPLEDRQYEWVRSVLRKHRDKPAKFVFGHLPIVPFAEGRSTEILRDRRLEALLKRHDVEMVLSGHHHAYYPGRRGSLKHVGLACLGGGARELLGTDRTSRHSAMVLRVHPSGHVDFHARWGPDMQRRIDRSDLPRRVEAHGWRTWRVDVPRRFASQD